MEINVVIIDFEKINREKFSCMYDNVTEYMKEKVMLKRNREDQIRSLVGEYYITTIRKKSNLNSSIIRSKYLKPYFYQEENFHYNIAHSSNMIVICIDSKPVGIDVEHIRRINYENIIGSFHEDEIELFTNYKKQKINLFFKLWTMKEAYTKMSGLGFNIPFDSFYLKESSDEKNWEVLYKNKKSYAGTIQINDYMLAWSSEFKSNISVNEINIDDL